MGLQFDPKFSIGNIVTIAVLIVGVVTSVIVMREQLNYLERVYQQDLLETEKRVQRFETTAAQFEARIRQTELTQASQSSDLRAIQSGINDIKAQLGRLGGDHPR